MYSISLAVNSLLSHVYFHVAVSLKLITTSRVRAIELNLCTDSFTHTIEWGQVNQFIVVKLYRLATKTELEIYMISGRMDSFETEA